MPMPVVQLSSQEKNQIQLAKDWLTRGIIVILVAGLLYLALRETSLRAIWEALERLEAWQILVILAMDGAIFILMSARWWLIVRAEDTRVAFFPLVAARLSAFGLSYFTIGPQVGGEPLQVLFLRRQFGSTYARATATVLLDKLLELLANFVFLMLGLIALIRAGVFDGINGLPLAGALLLAALASWPIVHIALLKTGRYPVSALLHVLPGIKQKHRLPRYIRACERLAGRFCQRKPRVLMAAIGLSLLAGTTAVIEYTLITAYLLLGLDIWKTMAAWTGGWLSFLLPLPGGIGALEASQVFILGYFGIAAASAIGVALVIRARDLLFGGLGLLLAAGINRVNTFKPLPTDTVYDPED